ncbi:MAG TPA: methyltransferase domain-containing protein [Blastocatellia bacterium]|nr:methyltransferase domain-containing protein [Blastocatellia bacterium]
MTPDQWEVFDLVEAFQLSHAVAILHELEVFAALKKPATPDELVARYRLDAGLLRGVLEYVAARTDLLRKSGERFVATGRYSGHSQFLLDLYVGAYGGNAAQLAKLLRDPSAAPKAVDRIRYARAFDSIDGLTLEVMPELIRRLELNHVLDLGCGNAALLVDLAGRDSQFVGWGIDLNRAMCRVARTRIRAARLGKRVQVLEGDCRNLASVLPKKVTDLVGAVTACNFANEMFTEGHGRAIAWLRGIRKILPGRPLLIADYYGRLGSKKGRQRSRKTLLHDYVQLISGQGVPPASAAQWRSIYSRAKCRLVHIIEDKSTTRFIHIVRL